MELSQHQMEKHLHRLKPLLTGCSLETARLGQDALGALLAGSQRRQVQFHAISFPTFSAGWIQPKHRALPGCLLYLHGGGYTCGNLTYAKGFGSVLAAAAELPVLCPAYRLAPEHPFPAALEDAAAAYQSLLAEYSPEQVILCGESSGGGLCYALCLYLKGQGLPLPAGIIGISPWTDLTVSCPSQEINRALDPSMTPERLTFFAGCYTEHTMEPLASPLFGDLRGLPPSLLFVGGNEVMLDDSRLLHEKLLHSGCESRLTIAPGLWHAYVLYGLKERRCDLEAIVQFCRVRLFQQ